MNKESTSGFFSGLLLGAVIGAAVALLYAPQSGEETRRLVKEKALDVKEKALEAKEKALQAVSKIKKGSAE